MTIDGIEMTGMVKRCGMCGTEFLNDKRQCECPKDISERVVYYTGEGNSKKVYMDYVVPEETMYIIK